MILLISRSTLHVAVAISSLLAATPARAQSDERAVVAAVTKFLDGIRTRDTSLMRSTVVSGATFVPVGGPTGLGAPSAIDGIIEGTGKGTGPGNDERMRRSSLPCASNLTLLRRSAAIVYGLLTVPY